MAYPILSVIVHELQVIIWVFLNNFYPIYLYLLVLILLIALLSVFLIYTLSNKKEKRNYQALLNNYLHEMEASKKELDDLRKQRVGLNRLFSEGLLLVDNEWVVYHANYQALSILNLSAETLMFHPIPSWFMYEVETAADQKLEFIPSLNVQTIIQNFSEGGSKQIKTHLKYFPTEEGKPGAAIILQDYSELLECHSKIQKLVYEKNEINKQLNCLFDICDICSIPDLTLDGVFEKSLSIIPNGLKFTHDVWGKITFHENTFTSANYKDTPWFFEAPIKVRRNRAGVIRVGYLTEYPRQMRDVFHLHEKLLIKNIAEKLGHTATLFALQEEIDALSGSRSPSKKTKPAKK
ncbi:MAG TPA: hypothetical protein DCM62_02270 [Bacteroidales bacterium]|nr:hypothetical protein [Bacteroidales bacterium]